MRRFPNPKNFAMEANYFSAFIREYPREITDIIEKEINVPTTTNSSII